MLLVLGAGPVSADDSFPNRPIRIVPFGTAGGPIDAIARSYGEALKQRWNQPVIVDAKPGA
ncbi:MAG TPA: tripartite tricarboxylate transporter substrate binding protein, partial [Burkholderiaceae bacterium]|nr:tripartite tricarboxylate transporter substrate binding protein [Burkholderiaceae bacterium]